MKRFLIVLVAVAASTLAYSQSVIVVDSEKIFKSLESYNSALSEVDNLSKSYQKQVDTKFAEVEALYNYFVSHKDQYSAATRQMRESEILTKEKEATELQEEYFAKDGAIMKRRLELIAPIQERVFGVIEEYAKARGADLVIDEASNPTLLYMSDGVNHTEAIIEELR